MAVLYELVCRWRLHTQPVGSMSKTGPSCTHKPHLASTPALASCHCLLSFNHNSGHCSSPCLSTAAGLSASSSCSLVSVMDLVVPGAQIEIVSH